MDKLAKRVGVAALVLIASAASAVAFGLYRMATSLESSTPAGDSRPRLAAALKLPETPEPVAAAPAEPPKPADAPAIVEAAKQDLASAFGSALGVDPDKHAARVAAAEAHAPAPSTIPATPAADNLNLGALPARDGKLGDREAKSASIHQTGGVEQQRKPTKSQEHLSFETELGTAPR